MDKIIITAAICGAEVTKARNPAVPYSPAEIAREARCCVDAGAAVIHLHVRNPDGTPTQRRTVYEKAFRAIVEACETQPIIQPSTGGALGMSFEERWEPLDCYPEMATLDCGTTNFGSDIFINDISMITRFAQCMHARRILPELECFEAGHVTTALRLWDDGILDGHMHFNFILNVPGAIKASARSLLFLAESIPAAATWTAAGLGRYNLSMAVLAVGMGGHVRVGLEDTIYYARGELATGNAQLVERAARIAREAGREPATPGEARTLLGIPPKRRTINTDIPVGPFL